MKVIFLDFDGVMNSERNLERLQHQEKDTEDEFGTVFDPGCVDNLRELIDRTGAKVVLITSWKRYGEEAMRRLWEGRNMPGEMIGITPNDVPGPTVECDENGMLPEGFNLFSLSSKGREIEVWMEREGVLDAYVILDDWPDFTEEQAPHYIRTDAYIGLTEKDVKRAEAILTFDI